MELGPSAQSGYSFIFWDTYSLNRKQTSIGAAVRLSKSFPFRALLGPVLQMYSSKRRISLTMLLYVTMLP